MRQEAGAARSFTRPRHTRKFRCMRGRTNGARTHATCGCDFARWARQPTGLQLMRRARQPT
eukprot:7674311-Pyramimonas_sp.AAC.1